MIYGGWNANTEIRFEVAMQPERLSGAGCYLPIEIEGGAQMA
jgi:hypothetical protein